MNKLAAMNRKMKIERFLILMLAILSCSENKSNSSENVAENEIFKAENQDDSIITEKKTPPKPSTKGATTAEHVIRLNFEEFVVEIDSLEAWGKEGSLKKVLHDTAKVYLEIGETIEGRRVRVIPQKEGEIKLYQLFENSITVMREGPHCDLTDWKHYHSEWKELTINNGEFLTDSYSEKDRTKFIDIDMNELREAVRNQCGDEWAEHIKDVQSPTEYPCGVNTNRIYLRVEFTGQDDGILKESIISFEIPMGC